MEYRNAKLTRDALYPGPRETRTNDLNRLAATDQSVVLKSRMRTAFGPVSPLRAAPGPRHALAPRVRRWFQPAAWRSSGRGQAAARPREHVEQGATARNR